MKSKMITALLLALVCITATGKKKVSNQQLWPNGEPMDAWFMDTTKVDVSTLGK